MTTTHINHNLLIQSTLCFDNFQPVKYDIVTLVPKNAQAYELDSAKIIITYLSLQGDFSRHCKCYKCAYSAKFELTFALLSDMWSK